MNILNTRELQRDIDKLEAEVEATRAEGLEPHKCDLDDLEALYALRDEIGSEWRYGVTLIDEADFEEYAREYAEDIGALDRNASWPHTCIDWELAAREMQHDFSVVEYDGTTWLYQA